MRYWLVYITGEGSPPKPGDSKLQQEIASAFNGVWDCILVVMADTYERAEEMAQDYLDSGDRTQAQIAFIGAAARGWSGPLYPDRNRKLRYGDSPFCERK